MPLGGTAPPDPRLDRINLAQAGDDVARKRGMGGLVDGDELATGMGKTKRELDVRMAAGQLLVAAIAVHLENAGKALDLRGEIRHRASVGIDVSDRGRGRTAPRAIINGMAPELTTFGLPASRIEDRHRGLIGEHAGPGEDDRQLALIERLQPPRGPLHPQRQGRAVEPYTLTGKDLSLPIEWDVPGELEHRDMGDERGCGHATLNQARRALGLDDRSLTGPAGVLREDRSLHPHKGWDHIESFARLLADPMQRTRAAGADRGLGLDYLLAPRQMLGKRTDVAQRRPAGSLQLALGPVIIVGGRWRRGGPDGQIVEIERELGDVDHCRPLRARSE